MFGTQLQTTVAKQASKKHFANHSCDARLRNTFDPRLPSTVCKARLQNTKDIAKQQILKNKCKRAAKPPRGSYQKLLKQSIGLAKPPSANPRACFTSPLDSLQLHDRHGEHRKTKKDMCPTIPYNGTVPPANFPSMQVCMRTSNLERRHFAASTWSIFLHQSLKRARKK